MNANQASRALSRVVAQLGELLPIHSTAVQTAEHLPCYVATADCFEFLASLPSGKADLALTDPPYGISRETGFKNAVNGVDRLAVSMDFGEWDHEDIDLPALAGQFFRVLRRGGTAIIWYDLWKITPLAAALRDAGFSMLRQLVWQKTNPVPLNSKAFYLSNSREIAVAAVKGGGPVFNSQYDSGVYSSPIPRHNGKRIHPTQKSVDIFRDMVRKHSNPGDVVIDPFLGSGTTAIAALAENRNFVGCEIDADYAEKARERIRREFPGRH